MRNRRLQRLRFAGAAALLMLAATASAQAPGPAASSAPEAADQTPAQAQTQAALAQAAARAQKMQQEQAAQARAAAEQGFGHDWSSWTAGNSVRDLASVQRGARDFAGYCRGCHALKYMRYSRLAQDLDITPQQLQEYLLPPGAKPGDYISTPMPPADAQAWFGKVPPDLSLMARARGTDYLFQFLTTFYADPTRTTGANNMRLPSAAMPDVLSELEGVKGAVFTTVHTPGPGGTVVSEQVFDHFVQLAPGALSHDEYLAFVRDLVNFLDYVGEPTQAHRRALGVPVVLFLLIFTLVAYQLKREYWKDIH